MDASTLTNGDVWSDSGFVKLNVTVQGVAASMPPDSAVSNNTPESCVHTPWIPSMLEVDAMLKEDEDAVSDPISPKMVTVDPSGRLKLVVRVIVILFNAPGLVLLC